jgi:hypothetical protein
MFGAEWTMEARMKKEEVSTRLSLAGSPAGRTIDRREAFASPRPVGGRQVCDRLTSVGSLRELTRIIFLFI